MKQIIIVAFVGFLSRNTAEAQLQGEGFIRSIDSIRQSLKIPGMYVVVKIGDSLLVDTGLGWADEAAGIKVTPQTTFRVASVTKTFTSSLVMQLIQKQMLNLDTPVSVFGINLGNPDITVRHLLTHTSEGIPGTWYHYNGYRFGLLTRVIEHITKKPFYQLLAENILVPLKMNYSAPGILMQEYFRYADERPSISTNFHNAFIHLAKPYALSGGGEMISTEYLNEFGAFGGLVTNAHDLLLYSDAIDQHRLVSEAMQQLAFTPLIFAGGKASPYGLGWFCQSVFGLEYYWHYGQTQGEGALFLKIPGKKLTLVITANSDRLSSPFPLGDGDIYSSPVAHLLNRYFLSGEGQPDAGSLDHLRKKELVCQAILAESRKDTGQVQEIYQRYQLTYFKKQDAGLSNGIASITNVGINVEKTKTFKLSKSTRITVEGTGEMCSPDGSSWCDYGWIENSKGSIVWQMQAKNSKPAGGAWKSRRVTDSLELAAGTYILKYKSDGGHAFNSWDDLPPDNFTWGIHVSTSVKK